MRTRRNYRKAVRETGSMVSLAYRMLEMAPSRSRVWSSAQTPRQRLKRVSSEQDFELRIQELAMEDVSGRFSDMAGVMQQLPPRRRETRKARREAEAVRRPCPFDFEDLTAEAEQEGEAFVPPSDGDGDGIMPQLDRQVLRWAPADRPDRPTLAMVGYIDTLVHTGSVPESGPRQHRPRVPRTASSTWMPATSGRTGSRSDGSCPDE